MNLCIFNGYDTKMVTFFEIFFSQPFLNWKMLAYFYVHLTYLEF